MRKYSYLRLLILCAIFSQGIAVISDDNAEDLTDLHIRKKRVIDKTRNGHLPAGHLTRAPYIVNILKNGVPHCAGTILESDVILTSQTCILGDFHLFSVLSGSPMRHEGTRHNITNRRFVSVMNHLVIFKILPPIDLQGPNSKIEPFVGQLPSNVYGTFAGWGCTNRGPQGNSFIFPNELMITRLPIITLNECIQHFHAQLTENDICTLDLSRRRGTCLGDQGGPLVYDNRLLGVLVYPGEDLGVTPDLFININEPVHRAWVIAMRNYFNHFFI